MSSRSAQPNTIEMFPRAVDRRTEAQRAMQAAGLSIEQIAATLGRSSRTVQDYVRYGCRDDVTGRRLAKLLGMRPEWFAYGWRAERRRRGQ